MQKLIEFTGPKGSFKGYVDLRLNDEPVTFYNSFNPCNTVCGYAEGILISRDLVSDDELYSKLDAVEKEIRRRLVHFHDAVIDTERTIKLKNLGYA